VSATALPPTLGGQRLSQQTPAVVTAADDGTGGSPSLTPVLLVVSLLLAASVAALATTGRHAAPRPLSRPPSVLVTGSPRGNPVGSMNEALTWSPFFDKGPVHVARSRRTRWPPPSPWIHVVVERASRSAST